MANIVVTAKGDVQINGNTLPDGVCTSLLTPLTITGTGEVFLVCNPNQPQPIEGSDEFTVPELASATIQDELGIITTIDQNTRYPEEGYFPLLRPLTVIGG